MTEKCLGESRASRLRFEAATERDKKRDFSVPQFDREFNKNTALGAFLRFVRKENMQLNNLKFSSLEKNDRKTVRCALCLFFVFLGLLSLFPGHAAQKTLGPVAGFIQSTGKVKRYAAHGEQWSYVSEGDYFYPGDVIATPKDVNSVLVYDSGPQVDVFAQTRVSVESNEQGRPQVIVYEGKARGRGIHVAPGGDLAPVNRLLGASKPMIASPGLLGLPSTSRDIRRPAK